MLACSAFHIITMQQSPSVRLSLHLHKSVVETCCMPTASYATNRESTAYPQQVIGCNKCTLEDQKPATGAQHVKVFYRFCTYNMSYNRPQQIIEYSRFFDFNFIIQYWLFIFALSYYTVLLFVIWAVVSAVAAFLTLEAHVLLFCSVFSDIVLFCVFKINWWLWWWWW